MGRKLYMLVLKLAVGIFVFEAHNDNESSVCLWASSCSLPAAIFVTDSLGKALVDT